MYVDRRLAGVQAVQTLSRLNRIHPGKEDTFVLDFVNDTDAIRDAFQPFYQQTTVSESADPNQLNQLQFDLDAGQIWTESELEGFAKVFYRPKDKLTQKEHEQVYGWLKPAEDRFKAWDDEDEAKEAWRGKLGAFVRLYAFLSQVMPYKDRELEMRFSYGRLLLRRLPSPDRAHYDLAGEVDLHSYRLTRIGETDIVLDQTEGEVKGPTAVGTGAAKEEEEVKLRELIQVLNERFGTEFAEADQLFVDHIVATAKADDALKQKAQVNGYDHFALSAEDPIQDAVVDGLDSHQSFVEQYLSNEGFKKEVLAYVAKRIWSEVRAEESRAGL